METKTLDFNYSIFLSEFNGELTEYTLGWAAKNKIETLDELLKKGHKGCAKLMNCGEKRLKEIENFVKKHAELEYNFYMRPVTLTSKEIEDIQSDNYLCLGLSHLNLPEKVMNFLDKKDINTIWEILELGVFGVRANKRPYQSIREEIEKELTGFVKKLSQENYNYFMRNQ